MIQNKLILLIIFICMGVILSFNPAFAQTQKDILDIRERLIRLEEGQKALNQRIDELDKRLGGRIDGLEKRMDYLVNLIYVVLAGMFTLVGFVLWDRRSALAPAIRRT